MTSRIGRSWTSTSYMDCSRASGSMPCDIVRLPCGSMSMQRTRWPSSAKAAARLSVVVVFATPPFWLANAMTFAVRMWGSVAGRGNIVWADSQPTGDVLPTRRKVARGGAGAHDRPMELERLSTPDDAEERIRSLYRAFNAREADWLLDHMTPDVEWPNAWEGGRVA